MPVSARRIYVSLLMGGAIFGLGACQSGSGSTQMSPPMAAMVVKTTTPGPLAANFVPAAQAMPNASDLQANASRDSSFGDLINAVRLAEGAEPLVYNARLDRAAQGHATDMVDNDYFSHVSQDGRTLADRVDATGYTYTALGENIARGQQSEQQVLDDWQGSSGHRANNENPVFQDFGLGVDGTGADTRWVLVLAAP